MMEKIETTSDSGDGKKDKLKITTYYTDGKTSPYTFVDWEYRDIELTNGVTGDVMFSKKQCKFPKTWSHNCSVLVAEKYFRKVLTNNKEHVQESTVFEMISRIVQTVQKWGVLGSSHTSSDSSLINNCLNKRLIQKHGKSHLCPNDTSEIYGLELTHILLNQMAAFNSPVWFNLGTKNGQLKEEQCSACFIVSVDDDIKSILKLSETEGLLYKGGSGSGVNYSKLRSSRESLSGGGYASGPVPFIAKDDFNAGAIKSGGTCLAPWQSVYTSEGPVSVKELADKNEDFIVFSYDPPSGRYKAKMARAWLSGKKKCVQVVTNIGVFYVTGDHPVRLLDGTYKMAGSLEANDKLYAFFTEFVEGKQYVGLTNDGDTITGLENLVANDMFASSVPDMLTLLTKPNQQPQVFVVCVQHDDDLVKEPVNVYDIEVDCPTEDDKSPSTGHNFVVSMGVCGVVVANTRRAAKIAILDVDHGDILEFINCKKISEQASHALIDAGFSSDFRDRWGAYSMVPFQNANHSVRVTDAFMRSVENGSKWSLLNRDGTQLEDIEALKIWDAICESSYQCGDPGLQFDTKINEWNAVKKSGRINGSNPCSEFMFLDNTACNLASINLLKYLNDDNSFDIDGFCHTVDILITAMDIFVDNAKYPTQEIDENSRRFRPLGLGFTNLGAFLMKQGIPYDSDIGRWYAGLIASLMTSQGYQRSAEMARALGSYEEFEKNRSSHLDVISKHFSAHRFNKVDKFYEDDTFLNNLYKMYIKAERNWENCIAMGGFYGFRNAQISVIAPAGTISFFMDCDTTGIEPDICLVKTKSLVGGGSIEIVNQQVKHALLTLAYSNEQVTDIVSYVKENNSVVGAPHIKEEHLSVFDTSISEPVGDRYIRPFAHLEMMAAVQPFISGAISKTCNLPANATKETISDVYKMAWKSGLKSITVYRDGSKKTQPIQRKEQNDTSNDLFDSMPKQSMGTVEGVSELVSGSLANTEYSSRKKLSNDCLSKRHKFTIGMYEGYIHVGLYPDGSPGEVFITMAKEGSTVSGLMDAVGIMTSICLQYGVPLKVLVDKFSYTSFEPSGLSGHSSVLFAKSPLDYLFRYLEFEFLTNKKEKKHEHIVKNVSQHGLVCMECGNQAVRAGVCVTCPTCGWTEGCG